MDGPLEKDAQPRGFGAVLRGRRRGRRGLSHQFLRHSSQTVASPRPRGSPSRAPTSLCNSGRVCVVGAPVLATGDAFQLDLRRSPPPGALAFGAACSTTPPGMHCADDSLCVASADFPGSPSAAPCAATTPTARRCQRTCPCSSTRRRSPRTARRPRWGIARRSSKIAGTACLRESDCPRTRAASPTACAPAYASAGRPAAPSRLGSACTGNADCRSGECFDRNFDQYGGQRAVLLGGLRRSTATAARIRLRALGGENNGTPDRLRSTTWWPATARRCSPRRRQRLRADARLRGARRRLGHLRRRPRALLQGGGPSGLALYGGCRCMLGGICSRGHALRRRLLPDLRLRSEPRPPAAGRLRRRRQRLRPARRARRARFTPATTAAQVGQTPAPSVRPRRLRLLRRRSRAHPPASASGRTGLIGVRATATGRPGQRDGCGCGAGRPRPPCLPAPLHAQAAPPPRRGRSRSSAVRAARFRPFSAGAGRRPPASALRPCWRRRAPRPRRRPPMAGRARSRPATRRPPPPITTPWSGTSASRPAASIQGPLPLALRPGQGCAAGMTTACTVTLGAVGARYWTTRNLALNGWLVLGAGGGRDRGAVPRHLRGVGPVVGIAAAARQLEAPGRRRQPRAGGGLVPSRPGGDTDSTTLSQLRAALEGELHFGFIGVPALSIGLEAGAQVCMSSAPAGHSGRWACRRREHLGRALHPLRPVLPVTRE